MNDLELRIVEYVEAHPWRESVEIGSSISGASVEEVVYALGDLIDRGVLRCDSVGMGYGYVLNG